MPAATNTMDLLLGTLALRPYVFVFLAAFVAAGWRDLGGKRTLLFGAWVWPLAWLAELSSTRVGIPFGLYHYTGATRGRELFIANVPFMDSLSFTFLAYASFCLARAALAGRRAGRPALALLAGFLMMALDVVIDPLAVRGDRWFLGRIFYYPEGGVYFGVPLSNFLGWLCVGTAGVGGYLLLAGLVDQSGDRGPSRVSRDGSERAGGLGGPSRPPMSRPAGGVALYYAVAVFNLAVTAWIGEWLLAAVGLGLQGGLALALRHLSRTAEASVDFGGRRVQRA